MTINNLAKKLKINFNDQITCKDFNAIASYCLKKTEKQLKSNWDYNLTRREVKKINKFWKQYLLNKPLAYIRGSTFFNNCEIKVNKNVLIPRNETELMVQRAIGFAKSQDLKKTLKFGDICSGSGAVGVSFLTEVDNCEVFATDICRKALKVAKINYNKFPKTSYQILGGNFLQPLINRDLKLNILAINPPYIKFGDKNIGESTYQFEPHKALFAKSNGLYFYYEFFENWEKVIDLENDFFVILEFGFDQKNAIEKLAMLHLRNYKFSFEKDYSDNWRFLVIQ
ncbi:N5-glutamine S-adenosyl-L-methionine-dependent methyltransferase [Spiroplasma sabaudiense Ar-1343]|uniref:peptide chain release factor N(5)-glutamine methyltransferase n=1 Tax=Spiroplasma sabaudiense Ar-1343 TaxID=1276257 RepID=W6AKI4_9MOLU|nr:HemK/PrmC family methyltransferase [Spiroplasma sabaudiense]AHI54214.1 N5-glutamine S-adenosyl-L-methionine-dependent methyltransferase [Spiroplasma sabaudiense Ar-1343]